MSKTGTEYPALAPLKHKLTATPDEVAEGIQTSYQDPEPVIGVCPKSSIGAVATAYQGWR